MKTVKNILFVAMLAMVSASVAGDINDIVDAVGLRYASVVENVTKPEVKSWFEYAKSFVPSVTLPTLPTFAQAQAAVVAVPGKMYAAGQHTVKLAKENPVTTAAIVAGLATTGTLAYLYSTGYFTSEAKQEVKKSAPEVRRNQRVKGLPTRK